MINVAAQVVELRLIDRVRVAEGSTYSPSVTSSPSDVFPGYGVVSASVETPPVKIDGFYGAVHDIAADLRAKGPTPDELQRAVKPRIETLTKAQQTNEYWMTWIAGAADDPAPPADRAGHPARLPQDHRSGRTEGGADLPHRRSRLPGGGDAEKPRRSRGLDAGARGWPTLHCRVTVLPMRAALGKASHRRCQDSPTRPSRRRRRARSAPAGERRPQAHGGIGLCAGPACRPDRGRTGWRSGPRSA